MTFVGIAVTALGVAFLVLDWRVRRLEALERARQAEIEAKRKLFHLRGSR